jgi:predicted nucleic acid-binding protein
MSRVLVLDAEALSSLARQRGPRFRVVRAAIEAARRLNRDVITPAVILAELYRGRGHNQIVDSCLSRESFIDVRDTDREFARYVGGVLTAAQADSRDLADAHAVAAAVEAGGGVVLTADEDDLKRLAGAYPNIHVERL